MSKAKRICMRCCFFRMDSNYADLYGRCYIKDKIVNAKNYSCGHFKEIVRLEYGGCEITKGFLLLVRFEKLKSRCTTIRGGKYLLPPDKKDDRWGIRHFGGCEPITDKRASKLIAKMEMQQKVVSDS